MEAATRCGRRRPPSAPDRGRPASRTARHPRPGTPPRARRLQVSTRRRIVLTILRMTRAIALLLALSSAAAGCQTSPSPTTSPARTTRFDVLIVGGRIVDGTGAPWFLGDVGIIGDRITAIGRLAD